MYSAQHFRGIKTAYLGQPIDRSGHHKSVQSVNGG